MSMETDEAAATSGSGGSGGSEAGTPVDLGAMTEEEQIAYAMRMSMQEGEWAKSACRYFGSRPLLSTTVLSKLYIDLALCWVQSTVQVV